MNGDNAALYIGANGNEGDIIVRNSSGTDTIHLDGNSGDIRLMGADVAEEFASSDGSRGRVCPHRRRTGRGGGVRTAHDRRVIGVASGTGDMKPALGLGTRPARGAFRWPSSAASTARSTRARDRSAPVTCSRPRTHPGHAMRVDDPAAAAGAIMGKALAPLEPAGPHPRRPHPALAQWPPSACVRSRRTASGQTGNLSVNSDVYGYIFREADGSVFGTLGGNDTFPGSGQPTTRSLRRHLETISGDATDLVLILVGHENDFVSGVTDRDDVTKVQYARPGDPRPLRPGRRRDPPTQLAAHPARRCRRLRRHPGRLGGGGSHRRLERAERRDRRLLGRSIGDAGGWSNVDGPCDKDSKDGGPVPCSSSRGRADSPASCSAMRSGHYLGLRHASSHREHDGRRLRRRRDRRDQQQQHGRVERRGQHDALPRLGARSVLGGRWPLDARIPLPPRYASSSPSTGRAASGRPTHTRPGRAPLDGGPGAAGVRRVGQCSARSWLSQKAGRLQPCPFSTRCSRIPTRRARPGRRPPPARGRVDARGRGALAPVGARPRSTRAAGGLRGVGSFGNPDVARELGEIPPCRRARSAPAGVRARPRRASPRARRPVPRRSDATPSATDRQVEDDSRLPRAPRLPLQPRAIWPEQGPLYGIDVASRGYSQRCGRREWTVFVNRELGRSFSAPTRLTDRAWVAAIACWWYPIRTIAMPQYVVLTRPVDGRGAHRRRAERRRDRLCRDSGVAGRDHRSRSRRWNGPRREPLRLAGRLTPEGS